MDNKRLIPQIMKTQIRDMVRKHIS
ncbi:hypothetical protein L2095_22500 [Bacillus zanthoxyli]|nr:hypothetical protein [Bacillus zanthoxyli]